MRNYIRIAREDYETAKTGRIVYIDHYWVVTENGELVFWTLNCGRTVQPQCHIDKCTIGSLTDKIRFPFPFTIKKIPIAYFNHFSENTSYWRERWQEQHTCATCAEATDEPVCSRNGYPQEISESYSCTYWKQRQGA